MKLARKLTFTLILLTLVVLGVSAELSIGRELSLSEADMLRDHQVMGAAMGAAFSAVYRASGEGRARALLDSANAGESQVRLRWIPLDDAQASQSRPPLDPSITGELRAGHSVGRIEPDAPPHGRVVTYIPVRLDSS